MRMLIATGGTGGHIYPALALADAAKERYGDIEILFVGMMIEWRPVKYRPMVTPFRDCMPAD